MRMGGGEGGGFKIALQGKWVVIKYVFPKRFVPPDRKAERLKIYLSSLA